MSGMKRRRTDTAGDPADHEVLKFIKDRKDQGASVRDLKFELKKLGDSVITKSIKSLLEKNLIKNIVNINFKASKSYMAVEFEPCAEITGGDWYSDGQLDMELVTVIKRFCLNYVKRKKVVTVEGVHNELRMRKVTKFELTIKQAEEIISSMVLDDEVIEVKSTGLAEYYSIPVGATCYRVGAGNALRFGPYASLPCGACPHIRICTPDGVISPSTCVYYTKWLDF